MGLLEFFNSKPQQQAQQNKNFTTGNQNIDNFCKRFYEKAGANYSGSFIDFMKLAASNMGLIKEMLSSPEIKQVENVANNAVNKGLVSKDTVNEFSKVLNLLK